MLSEILLTRKNVIPTMSLSLSVVAWRIGVQKTLDVTLLIIYLQQETPETHHGQGMYPTHGVVHRSLQD